MVRLAHDRQRAPALIAPKKISPAEIDDKLFMDTLIKEIEAQEFPQSGEGIAKSFGKIYRKAQGAIYKILPQKKHDENSEYGPWRPQPEEDSEFSELYRDVPDELHWVGCNYCGPFTRLEQRQKRNDKPTNYLDKVSMAHDLEYYGIGQQIRSGDLTDTDEINRLSANADDTMMAGLKLDPLFDKSSMFRNTVIKMIFYAKRKLENARIPGWEASKFIGVKPEDVESETESNIPTEAPNQIGNGVLSKAMLSTKTHEVSEVEGCPCHFCQSGKPSWMCENIPGHKMRLKLLSAQK
jgi:hypothetical protein